MRRRLLLSYLALTVFVLAILEIPLGVIYAQRQLAELTAQVERDAVVTATVVEDALEARQNPDVAEFLRRYASDTGARVVVVDDRGLAVADTSESAIGSSFANREEVIRALAGHVATGTRHSVSLGADLLYVAVPVASGGIVHGAVRITYSTSAVDARVRRSWFTLGAVASVSLLAAAALALALAGSVSQPLRRLRVVASEIGHGRLDVRAKTDEGPPEVRALARVFNDTSERLASLIASQDAFVADASHQLRSPLTALRLRLENLEGEVQGDASDDLRAAVAETRRLSRMVDELLALAQADRAAGIPATGVLDAVAALEERRAAWGALAEERGITLAVEPADGVAIPPVRATPDRLVQVIDNLLANALDAAPPSSLVELTAQCSATPGWVELHVLDRGPGLSDEARSRAFDRFWRDRSASRNGAGLGGSGLGLSIVRRLVAADGGDVELAARPGGGTDAIVRLAAVPLPTTKPAA